MLQVFLKRKIPDAAALPYIKLILQVFWQVKIYVVDGGYRLIGTLQCTHQRAC